MTQLGYIYKITNPNGKIYIGQTINLTNRQSAYRNINSDKQKLIYNSIKKYGWENHVFTILEESSIDVLDDREIYFIQKYNSFYKNNHNGMNMTLGGNGCRGRKDSEEVKLKRAEKHIGKKRTEETKKLMSLAKKGKITKRLGTKHSEETILKMSKIKLGKKQTHEIVNKRVETMRQTFLKKYGSILQYDKETNLLVKEWFVAPKEIMRQTNFDESSIIKCLKNKKKHAFNFVWKYKNIE